VQISLLVQASAPSTTLRHLGSGSVDLSSPFPVPAAEGLAVSLRYHLLPSSMPAHFLSSSFQSWWIVACFVWVFWSMGKVTDLVLELKSHKMLKKLQGSYNFAQKGISTILILGPARLPECEHTPPQGDDSN